MLHQFGLTSDKVVESTEALPLIKNKFEKSASTYRLIMMDFAMPHLDGPGVTRAIRQFYADMGVPRDQQSYICCMTGYQDPKYSKAA